MRSEIAVRPIRQSIAEYLKRHQLEKKFQKALEYFEKDINHPALNVELLEPKHLKVYSFRIDRRYRAVFVLTKGEIEIIAVTNHYK